eukprot:69408-Chlamydomonas_euryale.AAC.1
MVRVRTLGWGACGSGVCEGVVAGQGCGEHRGGVCGKSGGKGHEAEGQQAADELVSGVRQVRKCDGRGGGNGVFCDAGRRMEGVPVTGRAVPL